MISGRAMTANQPHVELHEGGPELDDVAEVGDAGPGVVDGDPDVRPETAERGAEGRVVIHGGVLGHLQHDRPVRGLQHAAQGAGSRSAGSATR